MQHFSRYIINDMVTPMTAGGGWLRQIYCLLAYRYVYI